MAQDRAVVFSGTGEETISEKVLMLGINRIKPNPFQPRREFSEVKIDELGQSIKACGLIQPVVVRRAADGYELVVGERRLLACRRLGWEKIPATVTTMSDDMMAATALIENLQRENLSYFEEAEGYARLIDRFKMTQEVLAQRLGKSQSTIANKLRLLKLPVKVKQALIQGKLSERHARAILRVGGEEQQLELVKEMAQNNLTVKQAEQKVEMIRARDDGGRKRKKGKTVVRDLRIVLNTIREAVAIINGAGLYPEIEERVEPEYIEVTIRLSKEMLSKKARNRDGNR